MLHQVIYTLNLSPNLHPAAEADAGNLRAREDSDNALTGTSAPSSFAPDGVFAPD